MVVWQKSELGWRCATRLREPTRTCLAWLCWSFVRSTCFARRAGVHCWRRCRQPSLNNLFIATTVGFGAVFLFGRTGEVVRPVVLPMRDPKIRPSASFVTIMVERIYDLLAVVVLFAANLLWIKPPTSSGSDLIAFGWLDLFF